MLFDIVKSNLKVIHVGDVYKQGIDFSNSNFGSEHVLEWYFAKYDRLSFCGFIKKLETSMV